MPLDDAFFNSGLEWATNKTYLQATVNPFGMGLILLFIMYIMLKLNDVDTTLKTAFYLLLFLSGLVWVRDKMVKIRLKQTNSSTFGSGVRSRFAPIANSSIKPREGKDIKNAYLGGHTSNISQIHPASYTASDISRL